MSVDPNVLFTAVRDFRRARREAALQELVARLTGRPHELLSYEEVRTKLRARETGRRQLREIPLEAIVGSVGRHSDFTRSFLPRRDSDQSRWAGVQAAVTSLQGLPPIDVYQVGEVYFVLDGNHRVSVARTLGATHIEAYVTEVRTRAPLSSDATPDALICSTQYAEFLERTGLDRLRPEADLSTSIPGQYRTLLEHIDVHRYFMGLDEQRDVSYAESVAHWYDHVYMPIVSVLRELGVLWHFPERTETDLYVLLAEHRAELEKRLGWQVSTEAAVADLAGERGERPRTVAARVAHHVHDAIVPDELESGPPPGLWRRELVAARASLQLFHSVLVAVSGAQAGWNALQIALGLAQREGSRLLGLHVLARGAEKDSAAAAAVRDEFERRCEQASVQHEFAFDVGSVARQIVARARWSDLVAVSLTYPPDSSPLGRLGSGLRTILRRSARPILAVPAPAHAITSPLLAYDGSPKADEALYIATYMAGAWDVPLTVVTVAEPGVDHEQAAERVRDYLEMHGVRAEYVSGAGAASAASDVILEAATAHGCDLIVMGGYGAAPVVEVVVGSTVDAVLRATRLPVMICR